MSRLIQLPLFRKAHPPIGEFEGQLPKAIFDAVREPLLVLDRNLRVVTASQSFYQSFLADPGETMGRALHELGDGHWNIPALRDLLEKIVPEHGILENYEVEQEVPGLGHRIMLVNARQIGSEDSADAGLLLAIEDVTDRRASETKMRELLEQKQLLLEEMEHRIANSLQLIASMLLLKAGTVRSDETQGHLKDAHRRVMSVAAVQKHLRPSGKGERIAVGPYLSTLCQSLEQSMVGDRCRIAIEAVVGKGSLVSSDAVGIGLIVTESVINALKHAFDPDQLGCRIIVTFEARDSDWALTISDNGRGRSEKASTTKPGLGTGIVHALGQQLRARIRTFDEQQGTTVSVVHSRSELPFAAMVPPANVVDIRDRAMSP